MRVLHVTPYFAPAFRYGGPAQSILGLCRGLGDAGVDVSVLTTTADGDTEIPSDVVRRGEYDSVPVRYLRSCFPRRYFNALGLSTAIRSALETVDVVHAHGLWSFPVWIATRECQRAGIPFVLSPRGMLDIGSLAHHRWRKKIAYRAWERKYLRNAALLHATSESEAESIARLGLGPRIVCVPNGVAAPATPPPSRFRERLGMSADVGLVVFLGRLHPIKRLDLLLAALEIVRSIQPGVRAVLAGPEDGLDASALVRQSGGPQAVEWVGEVAADDKWSLLSEADVLVSCSDSESFGMSVVEAMAMGTPVVTTKTCPWQDLENERAGLWVSQNAQDIADAIISVLRSPGDAREMGERGRALVRKRYQWVAVGQEMAAQYACVVA
jgi:glycosyltransferase involved in cell wall biosynthesis